MDRDRLNVEEAQRVLERLEIPDLVRLEMEIKDRSLPAFTADYDPFARA